jgi:CRP-like cAMP-binding protein
MDKPATLTAIKASPLLATLTEEEKYSLATVSRVVEVGRGVAIWLRGDETDFFGLVYSGFIKMVKGSLSGSDTTLELMGPGQIFGMLGTVEGSGCPLSAFAVTSAIYVRIPKRDFLPIYHANDTFKDKLIRRSAVRMHAALDLLGRMQNGNVEERIAAILYVLAESYGHQVDGGLRLDVPLTRQELGEMAGTTVETTIRVLSKWQKEGLAATDHHFITILDEEALTRILSQ